jgi:2-furoyl-CoA dehydrogenase large subunit
VKWVEDRLEHLTAASAGPNRITNIEAAVMRDGRVLALRMDQLEDYGAYLRPPMPAPLYRMHGASTGAYDIRNLAITDRTQQGARFVHSRLRRATALSGARAPDAADCG